MASLPFVAVGNYNQALTLSHTATILSAASLSGVIPLNGLAVAAFQMPAAWTPANLTFQASVDGINYFDLFTDAGTEVSVTAAASRVIPVDPYRYIGFHSIKIRSGTTGVPVAQGADRVIQVALKCVV